MGLNDIDDSKDGSELVNRALSELKELGIINLY